MADVILMGLPMSSYVRTVKMVLENKGVEYDFEKVDYRSDEYKKYHPFNFMPALKHNNTNIFETIAITAYIDEAFDGPSFQPDTPLGRAKMLQWISATNDYLYKSIIINCVQERFVKPMRGLETDEGLIARAKPIIDTHLGIVDKNLSAQNYLVGEDISLADYFLAPIVAYFAMTPEGDELLPSHTNLTQWMKRMEATKEYSSINYLVS